MSSEVTILEPEELARLRKGAVSAGQYVSVLQGMRPGQGGKIEIEEGGPGRQAIKNRLKSASALADVPLRFIRSSANQVLFEVFPPGTVFPKRKGGPGRPRKSADETA